MRLLACLALIFACGFAVEPVPNPLNIDLAANQTGTVYVITNATDNTHLSFEYVVHVSMPSNLSVYLQIAVHSEHNTITFNQPVGDAKTYKDQNYTIFNFFAPPLVTARIQMNRTAVKPDVPFTLAVQWFSFSLQPVNTYAVTLSPGMPNWIPFARATGQPTETQGALVVGFPAGDDLCITTPQYVSSSTEDARAQPSNDIIPARYSPIFVYDGESIHSPYLGTLEDVLGCADDRKVNFTKNTVTLVAPSIIYEVGSPVFTLKSVFDLYGGKSNQPVLLNDVEVIAVEASQTPMTFLVQSYIVSPQYIFLKDFNFKTDDATLQVWCGGLVKASKAGSIMLAELTKANLAEYTSEGVFLATCKAVTLRSTVGTVLVNVYKSLPNSMVPRVSVGSKGVMVNSNWPWEDEQSSNYVNTVSFEDQSINMLFYLQFEYVNPEPGRMIGVRSIDAHNSIKDSTHEYALNPPSGLDLVGKSVTTTVSGNGNRFRISYQVTGKLAASLSILTVLIAVFVNV